MSGEQDLMQKLMISKKIMDKHNGMGRNQSTETSGGITAPQVQNFQPIDAKYNIPNEFLGESTMTPKKVNQEMPTEDRIMSSKLPDEIKKLMIEHPIDQPTMGVNTNVGITNDLVEKASRLMNNQPKQNISESQPTQQTNSSLDIKSIIKETVKEVLKENGLITESETKSNEQFKFRVGQHLFEGKITKIKKIPKQ
jgi:hypothetical protein